MSEQCLADGQWPAARARAWADEHPWYCGCNFLPSSAVNFLEMWHPDTFDAATIERELGWAAELELNAVRVNLPFVAWERDRDGLMARLDRFLGMADRYGIATMPCLFDDCGFGGEEPDYGPQPDPVPGLHNGRAVASPGRAIVRARSHRPQLEAYVRDIVATFAQDRRIFVWDLYNEPGNGMVFARDGYSDVSDDLDPHSRALMRDTFAWARAVAPSQPLTVAAWRTPTEAHVPQTYTSRTDREALALSDVLSFHAYLPMQRTEQIILALEPEGRPLFCTEWMARAVASLIGDKLALMRSRNVGCFHWGLVRGRTQTHLPWPEELVRISGGVPDAATWFHDLLEPDGTPHDWREVALFRKICREARRS